MHLRRKWLGTTAIVGATLFMADASMAATVTPGGALDVILSGFTRFRAHGGDLDKARLDDSVSTGLDFSNDTEVHVDVRAKDDATGVEYGGSVEFEADTNRTVNSDETWLFVRSNLGEFRFGDEDGPIDDSTVFAGTIGAGTGGIDGDVIDTIATSVTKPMNSGDATKARYYTPVIGGFQLGVSYTPNVDAGGDTLAVKDVEIEKFTEGALTYKGSFGGFDVLASGVGGFCQNNGPGDSSDCYSYGGGASLGLFGFQVAGGYFGEKLGDSDKRFFNAGIAAGFGPANVSLTYGRVVDGSNLETNGNTLDHPYNLVLSADVGLLPGLVLAGDVSRFDNDVKSGPMKGDDDGYQAIVRLGLTY